MRRRAFFEVKTAGGLPELVSDRALQGSESNTRGDISVGLSAGLNGQRLGTVKKVWFGQIIRTRRRQLGLTQKRVAERIKTAKNYPSFLESGQRGDSQLAWARGRSPSALGCRVDAECVSLEGASICTVGGLFTAAVNIANSVNITNLLQRVTRPFAS